MKIHKWVISTMMGLCLFAMDPRSANAALLSMQIAVSANGVAQGSALGGGPALIISVAAGDTLTFVVSIVGTPDDPFLTSYASTVTASDPARMGYIAGSGVDLSGLTFALFADPDFQLIDATPGTGTINSDLGSVAYGPPTFALYELKYRVPPGVTSLGIGSLPDFVVTMNNSITSNGGSDSCCSQAEVNLNVAPEPGTVLLLGVGLAGLARFSRRRKQR